MILTPLNIQIAIIKAWYSIALKSIKYYAGLAVGKNNSCLLKEARLLRKYVEILRNFKIVGSTITCSCCLEGDYTVLLNDLTELTEAKIQFSCDNEGSMYFNDINYPFNYIYDADNKTLVIQFTTLENPETELPYVLTLDNVNFTSDCSFTPDTISPIEVGVIEEVTGIPVTVDNIYGTWDGNITIYEDDGTTLLPITPNPFPIPANIMDDPELITALWNSTGPTGWLLLYDGTQYTMFTPFDGTDYSTCIVKFNQYQGGVDSTINTTFIPRTFVPVGTRASVEIDIPNTFVGSVQSETLIDPPLIQPFVTSNTPALVKVTIPSTSFSSTQVAASMTISINGGGAFGSLPPSNQYFYYNSTLMFSHTGPYADPAALVLDFNNSNGNGFNMTYIGPSSTPNNFIFEIDSPADGEPYNGNTITVAYNALPYPDDVSTFSGGVSPKPATITVSDTVNGTIYNITSPLFNSLQDFIDDFNTNPFGYVAFIVPLAVSNNVEITAPPSTGFAFNGNTLTYSTTGRTYSSTGTYSGGIDTTECSYSLDLYDSGNTLVINISNPTPFNYASLADIVNDINSNFLSPYNFLGSVVSNQVKIVYPNPLALTCSTYNNYYFILSITYNNAQYIPDNYTSNQSEMLGGIDAVSNGFVITDGINGPIFSQTTGNFNYPNGSEIENGLVPDFNFGNTGALPLLYSAQYVSAGTPIPEVLANASNNFITQLTAATVSNSDRITALIDSQQIGKYDAPLIGGLPTYNQIILNIKNNIVSTNTIPGLLAISFPNPNFSTIILGAPTGSGASYNGKLFKINKNVYTLAQKTFFFTGPSLNPKFKLYITPNYICDISLSGLFPENSLANFTATSINTLGATFGFSASVTGPSVTITAPPYTGLSFNGSILSIEVNAASGNINIDGLPILPNTSSSLGTFIGGDTITTLIRQVPFINGEDLVTTSRVRFRSPLQPTIGPPYGTGNWAYNLANFSYDYNSGDYLISNTYSGGIDPTVGRLYVEILDSTLNPLVPPLILYDDGITPQNYLSRQSLVNIFNNLNSTPPPDFQINLLNPSSSSCIIQSPTNSFEYFNAYNFRYSYNYESLQYDDYIDITSTFSNGIDPTLTSYTGEFVNGDIGTFVTSNPCEPTTAEQECLSNKDITNIIRHIDRIVK